MRKLYKKEWKSNVFSEIEYCFAFQVQYIFQNLLNFQPTNYFQLQYIKSYISSGKRQNLTRALS